LFGLSEIIARVAVQLHLAQLGDGDEFLRHDLGGVKEVKSKPQLVLLIHNLNAELIEFEISLLLLFPMFTRPLGKEDDGRRRKTTYLPLRIASSLNCVVQILTHEVGILAGGLLGLFPDHAGLALQRRPVKFDELGCTVICHKSEGMHTESINVSERTRYSMPRHSPEQRVHRAWLLAEEVPGRIMSRGSLRDLIVASGLDGVDQIGEEDSILDEEYRDIVSNDIYSG
jgi:hypothetical protein